MRASGVMKQMAAPMHMPADLEDEMVAMENRTNYCSGVANEMQGFETRHLTARPARLVGRPAADGFDARPASSPKDLSNAGVAGGARSLDQSWTTLQNELAALSTRSRTASQKTAATRYRFRRPMSWSLPCATSSTRALTAESGMP